MAATTTGCRWQQESWDFLPQERSDVGGGVAEGDGGDSVRDTRGVDGGLTADS